MHRSRGRRRLVQEREDQMMAPNATPVSLDCNCLAVRAAARHVTQFYDQHLASAGLRTSQFSVLAKLRRAGPLTINALAEDMVMDRTTLGRNILPLQRDGLIRITRARSDRRAKELHLTEEGVRRYRAAAKGWLTAQTKFESTFGADRAAKLRTMLAAVAATEFPAAVDDNDRRDSNA
jgi:DNA-binding MarR family transcriptional regulator